LLALLFPALASGQQRAAQFDGDADYIVLGVLDPGTSFTVESWVRFDVYDGWETVIQALDPANLNSFHIGFADVNWVVEIEDINASEGTSCTTDLIDAVCHPFTITQGAPYHVAATVEPGLAILYIDGVEVARSVTVLSPGFGTDIWQIGSDDIGGGSDPVAGLMDEVRIWDHVRTPTEIQCTRDLALTGAEPGLYAFYPLDSDPGSVRTPDATGAHGNAAVQNQTTFVDSPFGLTQTTGGDVPCIDFDGDGQTPAEGDCDDLDAAIHGLAVEVCDFVDNDCSGVVDGADALEAVEWYADSDLDDYGDASNSVRSCSPPLGYTDVAGDCDDGSSAVNPLANEVCDGVDNDCDGTADVNAVDEPIWYRDADSDGWGDAGNFSRACFGPPGTVTRPGDCDDNADTVNPDEPEVCDGFDNNCDDEIDEGCEPSREWSAIDTAIDGGPGSGCGCTSGGRPIGWFWMSLLVIGGMGRRGRVA